MKHENQSSPDQSEGEFSESERQDKLPYQVSIQQIAPFEEEGEIFYICPLSGRKKPLVLTENAVVYKAENQLCLGSDAV